MTIEELIIYGKKYTHSAHAKMLLADLLNKNSLELLVNLQEQVPDEIVQEYKRKIEFLIQKKPIQYVIGNVNFYGNKFLVNDKVLIPRFETEELVERTLEYIKQIFPNQNLSIIDLGTGSGCIGITLKKFLPLSQVTLLDIDPGALEIAKENAQNLNAEVTIIQSDFWEKVECKYHVVISNPPYIRQEEEIEEIVKNNEPHLALYGGPDGLDCYRKIIASIKEHLLSPYLIAFEIGDTEKEEVISLLKEMLPEATIICHKDMQGRDRMVFAHY